MRKNRLLRLVLAATLTAAVSVLAFPTHEVDPQQVDWTYADETNPISPPDTTTPDYDGDGTPDPEDSDADGDGIPDSEQRDGAPGGDGDRTGPRPEGGGEADDPEVNGPEADESDRADAGGMLGLSFPVQAGLSIGVIALAFLALLPGRRMPASLR